MFAQSRIECSQELMKHLKHVSVTSGNPILFDSRRKRSVVRLYGCTNGSSSWRANSYSPKRLLYRKSAQITNDLTYDLDAWRNGYETCEEEITTDLGFILPRSISGTFYRNGPANFKVGEVELLHPFDGDGMVTEISIRNGKAIFRNRFVETNGYLHEKKTGQIYRRGAFRTLKPGGIFTNLFDGSVKNVANTNVLYWNNSLFALWEGGKPHTLHSETLQTIRKEDTLNNHLLSSDSFLAHPKIDAVQNYLVSLVIDNQLGSSTLRIMEFNDQFQLISERSFSYNGLVVCHDFAITENYALVVLPSVKFDLLPILLGQKAPTECISFSSEQPSKLFIIPRRNQSQAVEILDLDPHFAFHFANAFEKEDSIFFDCFRCSQMTMGLSYDSQGKPISWKNMDYEKEIPFPRLTRYSIARTERGLQPSFALLSEEQLDFGTINPNKVGRMYRYVYALCGSHPTKSTPLQGFVKIDTIEKREWKWMPESYEFIGEMTFIPKTPVVAGEETEDFGYLLSYLFNGRTNVTSIVLFDAQSIAQGPIVKFPLVGVRLPIMLHGIFVPNLTFNNEVNTRRK